MKKNPSFFRKKIPIIYEDDYYMVFNKPANLLVIPNVQEKQKTLTNIVNVQNADDKSWNLHPCHRLDKETSGAIVFAKGKKAQKYLMDEFRNKTIRKDYIAFVQGKIKKVNGVISADVKHLDLKKYAKYESKKSALTKYKVMEQKEHFAIVEIKLETGRTNQIRIHFSGIGHPIVGERK